MDFYNFSSLYLHRISDLDLSTMQVNVDFVLMLDWVDPSILSYDDNVNEDDHFSPYVQIHNAVNDTVAPVEADQAVNRKEKNPVVQGHVKRTERYKQRVYVTNLSLKKFPFDEHYLNIELKGDHIELRTAGTLQEGDEESPRKKCQHESESKNYYLPGWEMEGFAKDEILRRDTTGTTLTVAVRVKRNPYSVIMMLIFPLMICNALSLSSFMLDTKDLADRLTITVTMLLAIASFHQQVKELVPKNLPYTTVFDNYMLSNVVLFFIQGFMHVIISRIDTNKMAEDWACAVSQPSNRGSPLNSLHGFEDSAATQSNSTSSAGGNTMSFYCCLFVTSQLIILCSYLWKQYISTQIHGQELSHRIVEGACQIAATVISIGQLAGYCLSVVLISATVYQCSLQPLKQVHNALKQVLNALPPSMPTGTQPPHVYTCYNGNSPECGH